MADEEQQPIDETPDESPEEPSAAHPDTPDAGSVESAGSDDAAELDVEQVAADAASEAADEAMAAMLAATQAAIDQANSDADSVTGGTAPGAAAAVPAAAPAGSAPVALPAFDPASGQHSTEPIDLLNDVHLNVRIELGRTRMFVEDVLKLGDGCVVELDKLAGDPVDVFVNDRCVARGEVLVLNDQFCIRISEIVDPEAFEEFEDSSAA